MEHEAGAGGNEEGQQRRVSQRLRAPRHELAEHGVEEVWRGVAAEVVDEAGGVSRLLDDFEQPQLAEANEGAWVGHGLGSEGGATIASPSEPGRRS